MRSFFFHPVATGLQLHVRQHVLYRDLVRKQGVFPMGLFQLFFQALLPVVRRLGRAARVLILQRAEQRSKSPLLPFVIGLVGDL
jgi:hypothetical protein